MLSSFGYTKWLGLPLVVLCLLLCVLVDGSGVPPPAAANAVAGMVGQSGGLPAAAPFDPVRLVKDINPNPLLNTRSIGPLLVAGSVAYFSAETINEGAELWKSDGTPAGTVLVADLQPGILGSNPAPLAAVGGKLVFSAQDNQAGREPWVSDGTAQGTFRLADINPGPTESINMAASAIVLNGRLVFSAYAPAYGNEPWISDGTPQGTRLLADLNPGPADSNPRSMAVSGSRLYVFADNPTGGATLWVSDGTSQGMRVVTSLPERDIRSTAVLGGLLLFGAVAPNMGNELWRSDGTSQGTHLVTDINPGPEGSYPDSFVRLGNSLLFTANNLSYGSEIWASDGTAQGTHLVANIAPGSSSPGITALTVLSDTAYFFADYPRFGYNLWRSDGTAAGTTLVADIYAPVNGNKWGSTIMPVGATLFFNAEDGVHGYELWASNGTPEGTRMVVDLYPGANGSIAGISIPIVNLNGTALFLAFTPDGGSQLWKSDGTAQGTSRVSALNVGLGVGSQPLDLTPVGNEVLFTATAGDEKSRTIWRSDGSTRGTEVLGGQTAPLFRVERYYTRLIPVGQQLFILASALVHQDVGCTAETRLYRQTADGPLLLGAFAGEPSIKCIQVGATGIQGAVAYHSQLYFLTLDGALWVSDGTAQGTRMLKQLGNGLRLHWAQLVVYQGALYFLTYTYNSANVPVGLWRSDGTAQGTLPIRLFAAKSNIAQTSGYNWNQLRVVGGRLYFSLQTINEGAGGQFWTSNGTPEGTLLLAPLSNPACGLEALDDRVLLLSGPQLWVSNGTAQGTQVIRTFQPSQAGTWPAVTAAVEGTFYFNADDGTHGYELWASDGTPQGTRLVKDITPVTAGNGPQQLTSVAGRLLFSADDGTHGYELWQSDGTAQGTQLVTDLAPGSVGSNPAAITPAAGTIFFSAETHPLGRELWAIASAEGVDLHLEVPTRVGVTPGGVAPLSLYYRNRGATTALSPTLRIDLGPDLSYQGDSAGLTPTISGTQLIWPLSDLASMEHGELTLFLGVPSGELGSRLGLQLAVESAGPEAVPSDNQTTAEVWLAHQTRLPVVGR